MTFKEDLSDRRNSPVAIFHRFRVDGTIHNRTHVFVEGYDDKMYYSRHTKATKFGPPKFHICYGKKNLDRVSELYANSGISDEFVLFIRDSDFDHFLGFVPKSPNIFLTCGYSVENYICSPSALKMYLTSVLCLDESEADISRFVCRYERAVVRFNQWLLPLMGAAMLAIKRKRQIDLNKLRVSEHFLGILRDDSLSECQNLQELSAIGLVAGDFCEESRELAKEYGKLPAIWWLRGKFLLAILTQFLTHIAKECLDQHKAGQFTSFNRKAAAQINEVSILEGFASWAEPSDRLRTRLCSIGEQ